MNIAVDNMTHKSRGHLCAIINTYGEGGPMAGEDTLGFFQGAYVNECLDKAYAANNHEERRRIINELKEELAV